MQLYKAITALVLTNVCVCISHVSHTRKYSMDLNDHQNEVNKIKQLLKNPDVISLLRNSNFDVFSNSTSGCVKAFNNSDFVTYLDASGKPPAGILSFDLLWLGDYQECMKIPNAHYCLFGKIKITKFQQFIKVGLCVPHTCKLDNVVEILNYTSQILASMNINLFTVENNPAMSMQNSVDSKCYKKENTYSNGSIVMMVISSLIALLCLVGTITDQVYYYYHKFQLRPYVLYNDQTEAQKNGDSQKDSAISMHKVKIHKGKTIVQFLLCFSLIKNSNALFDTTVPSGAITSVNGIRTLSIMWVILGHTLIFGLSASRNAFNIFAWLPRFTMQAIENAPVSVDSFFLLSGLLVGYLSMKRYETHGKLPLLRYYVHRYIRLTPSYAYLIFFLAYLYPVLSDGPLWYMQDSASSQSENCIKYWWTNLLYINNFYPQQQNMCMNWSWYLANDMQFYVISPIILYCMHRFKWIGVVVANGLLLLACFITNGVLIHTEKASPLFYNPKASVLTNSNSPILRYMKYLYMKPYTRILPYIVGLVLGYILMKTKAYDSKKKYWFYGVGWLVAVGTGIAVVYGPYSTSDYYWKEPSTVIYGVLFRFAWAVAVGWVIYACHQGYGGLIDEFLSWKAFIPLSRLTYATYLVHPMVIDLFFFSTRIGVEMTVLNYAFFFTAVTSISFACAYIVAVCIEYPVFNLEQLILRF